MPRAGLTREAVVDLGARLADERGVDALTLAAVAGEAGVAVPSLYKHVRSLGDLRSAIALRGMEEVVRRTSEATAGVAGPDALRALARTLRAFAAQHPGVYALAQVAAAPEDEALVAASARAVAIIAAVLAGFGLPDDARVDAVRAVRAALHGFVVLEANGGFGLPDDPARSFESLLEVLIAGVPALGR